jgi:dTDP-4-dehydrorhamnose reductase
MRILVTGGSGFLGGVCRDILAQRKDVQVFLLRSGHRADYSSDATASFTAPPSLTADDLTPLLEPLAITHILHIGALSSAERCEHVPDEARRSNVTFTHMIADYATRIGAHLTTVSTDLVFDGAKAAACGFSENDPAHPISVYGRSKLAAEQATLQTPSNAVVRLALLFGFSPSASKGVLGWMERALREGTPLALFADEYRTPVHVVDAARALLAITEHRLSGLWHCGGPDRLSRSEFGELVAKGLGYDTALIRPVSRTSGPHLPARPEDVSLNSERLWSTLGERPRGALEALLTSW